MFTALLKDGMSHEKIDCVPTIELYKLGGLNKLSKKVQSSKSKDPGVTQPTAPPLEPQWDFTSVHGGPSAGRSVVLGEKEDWELYSDLYPWKKTREIVQRSKHE